MSSWRLMMPRDLAVLDRLERVGGNLAALALGARLLQRRRAQQAADMIGAKGGCGALHHFRILAFVMPAKAGHPVDASASRSSETLGSLGPRFRGDDSNYFPHTSSANSTIMRSLAHCSSSASTLPSSVEAKPHCGDRQSWSSATYLVASSMRRLMSSFGSSRPLLRGDQAEHQLLVALGEETQRLEAAGAVAVVFQEIAVDVGIVEHQLGHGS